MQVVSFEPIKTVPEEGYYREGYEVIQPNKVIYINIAEYDY
jgi:hypothetical protein